MSLVTIDGRTYDVGIVNLKRKARIDEKTLGTTLDGKEHTQYLGTYIDFIVTYNTRKFNVAEYDALYDYIISGGEHDCTFPYGQGTITGKYKASVANDSIVSNFNSFRRWSSLQVTFEALEYKK